MLLIESRQSRFAVLFVCLFSFLLLSSFKHRMSHGDSIRWTEQLKVCAETGDFRLFGKVAKKAMQEGYRRKELRELILEKNLESVNRAFYTSEMIMKRCKNHGLTIPEVFEMAMFIENDLPQHLEKGRTYFSRNITHLARSIQVDPETKQVFIHLKTHGVCAIGQGARKKVSPSILYSKDNPEMVAHCHTTYQIDNEVKAARELRGKPGLQQVHAVLERRCRDGRIAHSIMTKFYTGGDMHGFMKKNQKKLKLKQKLKLAHNIIVGIESMHKENYAHRDLGLRNYFIDIRKKGKHKKLVAVIGDFGRAAKHGETKERGAQGGLSQLAPEGIAYDKLQGDDYISTDIYALGCAFYRILNGKKTPWQDVDMMANNKISVDKRIQKAKQNVKKYWEKRLKKAKKDAKKHRIKRVQLKFERLISKMCAAEKEARPDATKIRTRLEKILKQA